MAQYPYGHPYYGYARPIANADDDSVSAGDQTTPGTYRTEIDVEHRNPTELAIVEANLASIERQRQDMAETQVQLEEARREKIAAKRAEVLARHRIPRGWWIPIGVWITFVTSVVLSILFMSGVRFTPTSVLGGLAGILVAGLPIAIIYGLSDSDLREEARKIY